MPNVGTAEARMRFVRIAEVLRVLNDEHSISFGVAEVGPDGNLRSLIIRADDGLLEARAARSESRSDGSG